MLLIILGTLVAVFVLAFAALRLLAPAITRKNHKIGAPGIDCMEMVEIGGIMQTLYFRGENVDNPVILYLHGGPGNPEMPLLHMFQYKWEKDYTVVHWDQRNAGKTYFANDSESVLQTMSAERVVEDAHEVTAYIRQQLNKDKIIIMGHSWGTALGTMLVQKYPEDYSAYIGVGQMIDTLNNERLGYNMVLEAARAAGNHKDIAVLESLAPYPPNGFNDHFVEQMMKLRKYQVKYKLAATGMELNTLIPAMASPYYTFRDLTYYFAIDSLHYQGDLWRFLIDEYDARNYGVDYAIPVYYIMGEKDYQTPYPLVKEYFEKISSPDKQFFSIPNAGHIPMNDNKTEFSRVLLEEIRPKLQ